MPKMKTCKSIAKRVKITARGKVKCYRVGRKHLLSAKNAKRKRHLRKSLLLTGPLVKQIRQALTYL